MNDRMLELLRDLTAEDLNRWRHHPVTELFLQFLQDQANQDRQTMVDQWEARRLSQAQADELRGRVLVMDELRELTIGSMKALYGLEPVQKAQ